MNKQTSAAFLIILSIFVLSLKDSASLIHTILHSIPNNPWHQHSAIHSDHHHHINPLEIHKYLQNKHSHNHEHAHAHDLMDHLHTDTQDKDKSKTPSEIKIDIKADYFFQDIALSFFKRNSVVVLIQHRSNYHFSIIESPLFSPFQPPQA